MTTKLRYVGLDVHAETIAVAVAEAEEGVEAIPPAAWYRNVLTIADRSMLASSWSRRPRTLSICDATVSEAMPATGARFARYLRAD
jgi:hypothetical protein